MQAISTIGLDIAKSVFQVHSIDAEGKVVGTSQPESGSCRSSILAGARTSSAASPRKAIAICAAYSPPAHLL